MVIKKKYFIWKRVKQNDRFYSHPNTNHKRRDRWKEKSIIIQEYPYQQNGWYLGHIEWDNDIVTAAQIKEHADDFVNYEIQAKTPIEVIDTLNNFYPPEDGDNLYFSLDTDEFTIIDNRPIEEEI